mmetsp:Transcript_17595/g.24263  ORF Transcript_17595/g.24263 Transcript_17595/m.24263 type:complete len:112 (-) Transcript_17595:89-424(-)
MHCSVSMPGEGDHLYSMFVCAKRDVLRQMRLQDAFVRAPIPSLADLPKGTRVIARSADGNLTALSPRGEMNTTSGQVYDVLNDGTLHIKLDSGGIRQGFLPHDVRVMPAVL